MAKVQAAASLSERAVQKVAAENITFTKPRRQQPKKKFTKVKVSHWSDGVDPRVVAKIKSMRIPQVWRRIEVVGPTDVIIHNNAIR